MQKYKQETEDAQKGWHAKDKNIKTLKDEKNAVIVQKNRKSSTWKHNRNEISKFTSLEKQR